MEMDLIEWVILAVGILLAIAGLFIADAGGGVYGLGLAIFVVAVVFVLWLIKRHFDRADAARH
jgi:membrane protein implicated in regulation of membrane protease activity